LQAFATIMERVPPGLCDQSTSLYCSFPRRDGRVAEGARLESVYTGNRIVGSNPTPSAKYYGISISYGANAP
jgi:hypothetical protein